MGLAHNIYDGQRTQDICISQDVTFDTMLLKSNTLKGLKDSGFYKPSPIQLHGIPLGKCGFDLLLEAKSGTGKTAVFTVIALEKINLNKGLQVVILAPTREIAMQISDVIKQIGSKYQGLQVEVVMGGLSLKDDIEKFKKNVHIVVGSPGRLKHLMQDKFIDTSTVRLFILDEADKLMEKGFQTDIDYIHLSLPQQKQVILCSATYPESSKTFIKKYVRNAQHICPDSNNVLLGIEQKVTIVKHNSNIVRQTQHRFLELLKILSNKQFKQCLIFCNYQTRVGEIHKMLGKAKWPAEQLYGQQEQTDRLDALKTLQEYKCRLLISTDLAARGIDASNIDLIINFEPPFEWQTYLHRIGRAGRFGSYGTAVTILSEGAEENKFKTLLESIKFDFQLTHFWSNDHFSVYIDEKVNEQSPKVNESQTLNQKMSTKDNCIKLWTALTKDNKLKEPLESFDSFCKAFNESDAEGLIEVFDDLVLSFQSSQHNISEETEFVKLKLLELPLNENNIINLNMCKNVTTFESTQSDKNNKQDDGTKIEEGLRETDLDKSELTSYKKNGNQVSELKLNKGKISNSINMTNLANEIKCDKDNSKNVVEYLELVSNDNSNDLEAFNVNSKRAEMNNANFKNEKEDIYKTLVDMGLPTSFFNAKSSLNMQNKHDSNSKKNRKGYNKSNGDNNPHLLNCTSTLEQTCQANKKKVIKPKNLKGKPECKINSEASFAEKSFCRYENSKIKKSAVDNMEIQKQSRLQSNSYLQYRPKKFPNNLYLYSRHRTNLKEKDDYNNWYNTLKFRVKQIEMIMYLNEINNL